MQLGTKGRYAVMAMTDLAGRQGGAEGRAVALAEIAARQEISLSYLEQLFSRLRRRGLVVSARGPGGGYRLAKAEELLGADLSDPATVASVHLALTALELADPAGAGDRYPVPRRGGTVVHDADSPETATRFDRPGVRGFGVVSDPNG